MSQMRQIDWDLSYASINGDLEKAKRASWKGHKSIVSLLLEKGADVNIKDIGGETPLLKASSYGDAAVVSLLLENGAYVNVKAKDGSTPKQIRKRCRHFIIVGKGRRSRTGKIGQ